MTRPEPDRSRSTGQRLLVASNRLPVQLERGDDGRWVRTRSSGGLVSALEPVLRRRGGTWVGWPGVLEEAVGEDELREVLGRGDDGFTTEPVSLTGSERRDFYLGFSNEILWPLCHGLQSRCNFEPRYWDVYRKVNRKFSEAVARVAEPDMFLWIHDYHLMAVAEELRRAGVENPAGFFLHIPFPGPDIFEQLPWASEVMGSLLRFDLVGFQSERDRGNFLDCVEMLAGVDAEVLVEDCVEHAGREVAVGVFPISIDNEVFRDGARAPAVGRRCEELRADIHSDHILLGVDRLDYTKGIPQKLEGFERALEKHPELQGRVSLVQLVVPSRENIPEYHRMREEIERLVGRINGRFTKAGWAPILYQFGSWDQTELLAFYRAADVALVTPLRDGMNLVSKEFCAASVDGRGVLVLSSFAGSADELSEGALMVNPFDVEALADVIHTACTMDRDEQARRLDSLRGQVEGYDVHAWVERFLRAADARGSDGGPEGTSGAGSDAGSGAGDPRPRSSPRRAGRRENAGGTTAPRDRGAESPRRTGGDAAPVGGSGRSKATPRAHGAPSAPSSSTRGRPSRRRASGRRPRRRGIETPGAVEGADRFGG